MATVVGADFTFVAGIQPAIHRSAVLYRVQEAAKLPLALFVGVSESRSGTWAVGWAHTAALTAQRSPTSPHTRQAVITRTDRLLSPKPHCRQNTGRRQALAS